MTLPSIEECDYNTLDKHFDHKSRIISTKLAFTQHSFFDITHFHKWMKYPRTKEELVISKFHCVYFNKMDNYTKQCLYKVCLNFMELTPVDVPYPFVPFWVKIKRWLNKRR